MLSVHAWEKLSVSLCLTNYSIVFCPAFLFKELSGYKKPHSSKTGQEYQNSKQSFDFYV